MSTEDLAAFLLARIAEDEAVARAAGAEDEREWVTDGWEVLVGSAELGESQVASVSTFRDTAAHIARWDPARVLAECEARRRVVELHKLVTEDYAHEWWTDPAPPGTYVRTGCDNCRSCGVDGEAYLIAGPCLTLRLLALPYAGHPDFRSEWGAE